MYSSCLFPIFLVFQGIFEIVFRGVSGPDTLLMFQVLQIENDRRAVQRDDTARRYTGIVYNNDYIFCIELKTDVFINLQMRYSCFFCIFI